MFCTHCGRQLTNNNSIACPECGAPTDYYYFTRTPHAAEHEQEERAYKKNGARCANAGFILSLISSVAGMYVLPTVAAYILSLIGLAKTPEKGAAHGRAVAGTVISCISCTLWSGIAFMLCFVHIIALSFAMWG